MLRSFLTSWRTERRNDGFKNLGLVSEPEEVMRDLDRVRSLSSWSSQTKKVYDLTLMIQLVDTVLAKLYLETAHRLPLLLDMLEKEAHDCDVNELAPHLEGNSLHWYLSQLYLLEGKIPETLQIWTE